MKLTRRKLAAIVAASAAAPFVAQTAAAPLADQTAGVPGQTPPAPTPDGELKAARDRLKANGDKLAQHALPMATEPAFQFRV